MRFDQVKLAADDPERLTRFYVEALHCAVQRPLTTVDDEVVSRGIGAPGHVVELTLLTLPGRTDETTPRLELYRFLGGWPERWRHLPGTGQLAFFVEDVDAAARRVLAAGGSMLGEIVDWVLPQGNARFAYLTDPEGNIIDLWTA